MHRQKPVSKDMGCCCQKTLPVTVEPSTFHRPRFMTPPLSFMLTEQVRSLEDDGTLEWQESGAIVPDETLK